MFHSPVHDDAVDDDVVLERGLLTVSDEVWALAVRRAGVIGPLAEAGTVGVEAVETAAERLGISRRQVYVLLRRWREGQGVVSDLIPGRSSGGRGGQRLSAEVEAVIREVLGKHYLTRQRKKTAAVHREITQTCRTRGLPVPSRGVIVRRIAALDPRAGTVAREGRDAARSLESAGGRVPPVSGVLEQVQIDHTVVDLIVVDERHRLPIGRPYVTVAIDVFSRSIVGLVITLEAPSALSVGLCLAHMVTDKRAWVERLGIEVGWPMAGKPGELFLDNAAEFKSEALRRGCQEHGITLRYRPPGRPHYGGIVERVIGTLMEMVHELPGTTFSNPAQRGDYDSESKAVLTVAELEKWLALAVASYHGQVHSTTRQTPQARWATGTAQTPVVTVTNETAFLVDFLPVFRRTLTRTGFVLDHVHYFSDALKPWIARRDRLDRFVIRRDPRDLSRIWVLDPEGASYLPVPYRTLSHPAVSVWEHRAAVERLRAEGRAQVDEEALFRMVEQMRTITDTAGSATRRARRDAERRGHASAAASRANPAAAPPDDISAAVDETGNASDAGSVAPFEVIEQW
ncbi:Mu transposase C-terminal domain-containing protein [Brachybacterium fresconis]|uniref:Mu transposase C-terminal domain-containing protein n=1 Tax=Brachybacterium fresconis TaxID=173363 RepID=UPI001FD997CD|nr:Mu transposase C-terminal domain-containing protein [Brachybacterium fresconis]